MSRITMLARLGAATLMASGLAAVAAPGARASSVNASHAAEQAVCGPAAAAFARCHAHRRADTNGGVGVQAVAPQGFGPGDLQAAYSVPYAGGSTVAWAGRPVVAVVDAYDDPYAEKDLQVYRAQYGLPACTTANGCFRKVSQTGSAKRLPRADTGWGQEISLDLDMVSATCPDCRILLVEANSARFSDLATAENYAASQGPVAISNSYGGSEWAGETSYDQYYNHPGIAITVSTGDNGYQVQYPAASQYVTAVGGTSLVRDAATARGWTESAWSGAGSGCSLYEPKPTFQDAGVTGCAKRAVADVSAVADPNTGVAVYDTYVSSGAGWMVFGGTSAAAPIVASVYALAGNASTVSNAYPYSHTSGLNDVTSGNNGTCPTAAWCNAGTGWDGPTGLGTPLGTSAF